MATAKSTSVEPAGDRQHRTEDTIADSVDRALRAAGEVFYGEDSLAQLWLELTQAQVTHNVEAMQELLACRDWRAAAEVQQAFIKASVARLGETMLRQIEITGTAGEGLLGPNKPAGARGGPTAAHRL